MADLPIPQVIVYKNNFNIIADIEKYLFGVTLEEIFDSNFTPSKLELYVHPKYPYSWTFNDKLRVLLYWNQFFDYTLFSAEFYLDYVDDNRTNQDQRYTISGIEQDLKLSETFKKDSITYSNQTILTALNDVGTQRGLTVSQNADSGVYLGTFPDTSQVTTVTKKFSSYLEVVQFICNTYGYIGNLSAKNLQVYKLSQPGSITVDTPVPSINRVISISARNQINQVAYQYKTLFIDRANANTLTTLTLTNPTGISNKVIDMSDEGIYFNVQSASARNLGRMYQDYYASFTIRLTYLAREYLRAGKYIYLDSNYGNYEGYYITLNVTHKMVNNNWVVDVDAFPMRVISGLSPTFQILPIYSTSALESDYGISQIIDGFRNA